MAMEERVAQLGLDVKFQYIIGHNLDSVLLQRNIFFMFSWASS
jgi:hypothetical protein